MCKLNMIVSGLAVILLSLSEVTAQDSNDTGTAFAGDTKEMEKQLDATRERIFKLFNEEKYKEFAEELCHEDITGIWNNGVVTKGRQELIDFLEGLGTKIEKMRVNPSTKHRVFYGGGKYVISLGSLGDTYVVRGKEYSLGSSWMATLMYEGGKWQLISFSSSTNAFDNPIYEAKMKAHGLTYGSYGLISGLLICFIGGRIWCRRKAKGEQAQNTESGS